MAFNRERFKNEPAPDEKIVGGTDVLDLKERPFQVAYLWFGSLACGGSIIDKRTVLTAAHCCRGDTPDVVGVRAGSLKHASGGKVLSCNMFNACIIDASWLYSIRSMMSLKSTFTLSMILEPQAMMLVSWSLLKILTSQSKLIMPRLEPRLQRTDIRSLGKCKLFSPMKLGSLLHNFSEQFTVVPQIFHT